MACVHLFDEYMMSFQEDMEKCDLFTRPGTTLLIMTM